MAKINELGKEDIVGMTEKNQIHNESGLILRADLFCAIDHSENPQRGRIIIVRMVQMLPFFRRRAVKAGVQGLHF